MRSLTTSMRAFFEHPDQWELFKRERPLETAVDEILRWATPVIEFQRTATRDCVLAGQQIQAGERVVLYYSSANRDDAVIADPDRFDITRNTQKSIAFGAGPHYCAGAFASRAMVADVALPSVFERLKGLRLDHTQPVRIGGWAFRGLLNLPVMWDAG